MPISDPVRHELARYHRELIRIIARRIGAETVAFELLQSAFVRAPESRLPRRGEGAVSWFGRALFEAHEERARIRSAPQIVLTGSSGTPGTLSPGNGGMEIARDCVLTVLSFLKPPLAEVLLQVDVEGVHGVVPGDFTCGNGVAPVRIDEARDALYRGIRQICRTCVQHARLDCECQESETPLT